MQTLVSVRAASRSCDYFCIAASGAASYLKIFAASNFSPGCDWPSSLQNFKALKGPYICKFASPPATCEDVGKASEKGFRKASYSEGYFSPCLLNLTMTANSVFSSSCLEHCDIDYSGDLLGWKQQVTQGPQFYFLNRTLQNMWSTIIISFCNYYESFAGICYLLLLSPFPWTFSYQQLMLLLLHRLAEISRLELSDTFQGFVCQTYCWRA